MWLLSLAMAHAAVPFAGVEFRPLSRQDLVWVEEGRTSGTAVGAQDGVVRPNLGAFGGAWFSRFVGVAGSVGVARRTVSTRVDDVYRQRHQGVVRLGVDLRIGWLEPELRKPIPWFMLGLHGDIPSARDVSNGFTAEEQDAADRAAATTRYRLGGVGGRVGMGLDYRILPGLAIGAVASLGLHRSFYLGGEDTPTTLWLASDVGLLLTFEWPEGRRAKKAAAAAQPPAAGSQAVLGGVEPAESAPEPTPSADEASHPGSEPGSSEAERPAPRAGEDVPE